MNTVLQALNFWHWFGLGVALVILDVALGANFVLLWSGLAAGVVGLMMVLIPKMSWEWQFAVFGIGVFMSLAFWRYHLKKMPTETDKPFLNRRAQRYIGHMLYLQEPIVHGKGKIVIDDASWHVQGEDMPVGTQVKVVEVDGMVLKVEKV